MKIALATDGKKMHSTLPFRYEDSTSLIIYDAEATAVARAYDAKDLPEGVELPLFFADQLIEWDCEALICGTLDKESFNKIADAGITRYYGAGMKAQEAFDHMMKNQLNMTVDFVGGTGCGGHEAAPHDPNCPNHHD